MINTSLTSEFVNWQILERESEIHKFQYKCAFRLKISIKAIVRGCEYNGGAEIFGYIFDHFQLSVIS